MKRIIGIIILLCVLAFSLTSCKKSAIEGTYYKLVNNVVKEDEYLIISKKGFRLHYDMNGKSSGECLDFSDTYVKFSYPVEWYDFSKNEHTTINKIVTLYLEGDILSSNPDNIYYGEVYCRAGYDPNKNS